MLTKLVQGQPLNRLRINTPDPVQRRLLGHDENQIAIDGGVISFGHDYSTKSN